MPHQFRGHVSSISLHCISKFLIKISAQPKVTQFASEVVICQEYVSGLDIKVTQTVIMEVLESLHTMTSISRASTVYGRLTFVKSTSMCHILCSGIVPCKSAYSARLEEVPFNQSCLINTLLYLM